LPGKVDKLSQHQGSSRIKEAPTCSLVDIRAARESKQESRHDPKDLNCLPEREDCLGEDYEGSG
jgi:hypothetical protein